MFNRKVLDKIKIWSEKTDRKPLILRGARQVGKSTLVGLAAKGYEQFIHLNLELPDDRRLFKDHPSFSELVDAIFFLKDARKARGRTLILIDEIQACMPAVEQLRYFYEQAKDLHVIAAGSLLESLMDSHISFPVGRVEYLAVRPVIFSEFLDALNETQASQITEEIPIPAYAHEKLLSLFRLYTLLGGMPEAVKTYAETRDVSTVGSVYENLLVTYMDDVEKYARNQTMARVIRHAITSSFFEASKRIRFQGFGQSQYKSREMSEALKVLEKAMLLRLHYPTTSVELPILADYRKAPKLQLLDTGLVNYAAGLQRELFGTHQLQGVFEGRIAEHIVTQEIIGQSSSVLQNTHFWVRQKKQSQAEVDLVVPFEHMVIPIEIKAGSSGTLRSLHQFMDRASHPYAVRVYSGKLGIDRTKTIKGKSFYLLNLPFYLAGQMDSYIRWFIDRYQRPMARTCSAM